jgi:hypothetical protein
MFFFNYTAGIIIEKEAYENKEKFNKTEYVIVFYKKYKKRSLLRSGHEQPPSQSIRLFFVKHDLKGVLKCIGVKVWTYPPPPPPHLP